MRKRFTVSVSHIGTSARTVDGYGSFSRSYRAVASGGQGDYLYKFEVFTSARSRKPHADLTRDFSREDSYGLGYKGYEDEIGGYVLKVTARDGAGNQAVCHCELLQKDEE